MGKTRESLQEIALRHAGEAFREQKEQVFLAMDIVRQIIEWWSLRELEEQMDLWEDEKGKSVPLKEILRYGMKIVSDEEPPESWEEKMYGQAVKNGYSGYEWYITYIYLTGMKNIDEGSFSTYYQFLYRALVPEQWQGDYDSYWRLREEEERSKGTAEYEKIVHERFQEASFIKAAFHRRFGEMEPESLEWILKEMDYKTLARGIYLAEEPLRMRILEHITRKRRELIMEEWCRHGFNDYCMDDILEAMQRMLTAAGLAGEMSVPEDSLVSE